MTRTRVPCDWSLCLIVDVLLLCNGVYAQAPKNAEDDSHLYVHREQVSWPSPESVLNDLRSPNDETRLAALKLAGLTEQQARRTLWSSGRDGPAKVIGRAVITAERVQLMYAAIGEDRSQQSIVAFKVHSLQAAYAAVAVRDGKRWLRIAALDCWCKYDMNPGQDRLAELVSLRPAAEPPHETGQHYDLVLHSSGGGTGTYTQDEAHYRVFHNELRNSLQLVSSFRSADPAGPAPSSVMLERRWFSTAPIANGVWGAFWWKPKEHSLPINSLRSRGTCLLSRRRTYRKSPAAPSAGMRNPFATCLRTTSSPRARRVRNKPSNPGALTLPPAPP
jgi:hypothetical protein